VSTRFARLELDEDPRPSAAPRAAGEGPTVAERLARADDARLSGRFEPALRDYARALAEDAHSEAAWLGQLECLLGLGQLREADAWVDRAIATFPTSADLMAMKGLVLARLGDVERALAFIDGALKRSGGGPIVWIARAEALLGRDTRNADFCVRKAIEQAPADPGVRIAIGRAYLSAQLAAPARPHLVEATRLGPQHALGWLYLGLAHERLGLEAAALEAYREAHRLVPEAEEPKLAIARLSEGGLAAVGRRALAWIRGRR
jgi:tetratricopeptide (TPR) repeat protein